MNPSSPHCRSLVLVPLTMMLSLPACSDDDTASVPQPIGAVQQVDAQVVSARNIRITWADAPAEWVVIERASGDGTFEQVARKQASRQRFLDLALQPETSYRYRVMACSDEQTCGEPVTTESLTTPASQLPTMKVLTTTDQAADTIAIFGVFRYFDPYVRDYGQMMAVDKSGTIVWEYRTEEWGPITELEPLADGTLATGQFMYLVQIDLDGTERYRFSKTTAHHDIDQLSDGRFAFLEFDTFEEPPGYVVLSDSIGILNDNNTDVAWRWVARDHIPLNDADPADMEMDMFKLGHDFTHANAITFDEAHQKIYLNLRNLDRIYKIDYPSGNVDWIMGRGGDFGEGLWSHSHDPIFVAEDRFLVFDNGNRRGPGEAPYSRVIEVQFDEAQKKAEIVWEYRESPDFYSIGLGSAHLEPNGNVLVNDGFNGRVLEVTRDKQVVWEISLPLQQIYKVVTVPREFFSEW